MKRRFRRQPFILLSFSSSKKARKAQEMQSYQRFQCIGHMGFKGLSNAVTNTHPLLPSMGRYHAAKKLLSQWPAKRPTFAFAGESGYTTRLRQQDRTQRLTRRNRGLPDRAAITTLGAFRTFTNIPGPGVRTAYFAAFGSWPGVLPKNAESLRDSDAHDARRCPEASRPRWAA